MPGGAATKPWIFFFFTYFKRMKWKHMYRNEPQQLHRKIPNQPPHSMAYSQNDPRQTQANNTDLISLSEYIFLKTHYFIMSVIAQKASTCIYMLMDTTYFFIYLYLQNQKLQILFLSCQKVSDSVFLETDLSWSLRICLL